MLMRFAYLFFIPQMAEDTVNYCTHFQFFISKSAFAFFVIFPKVCWIKINRKQTLNCFRIDNYWQNSHSSSRMTCITVKTVLFHLPHLSATAWFRGPFPCLVTFFTVNNTKDVKEGTYIFPSLEKFSDAKKAQKYRNFAYSYSVTMLLNSAWYL